MDDKEFKKRKFWATIIVVSIVIIAICGSFLLFRKKDLMKLLQT